MKGEIFHLEFMKQPGLNWKIVLALMTTDKICSKGLRAVLQLLGQANVERVYLGGSFVSSKEYPNDFDGCYDDLSIDYDLLDPIFDEDLTAQQDRFGGELLADPTFQGFFQTDRDGNPRGIVAIDPKELLQ